MAQHVAWRVALFGPLQVCRQLMIGGIYSVSPLDLHCTQALWQGSNCPMSVSALQVFSVF
jgi:hypothetical protein